ncbi:MAG: NAD(P)H-hydrate dehydratase [Clostridiales bacterium]|nr:NAD(P)H-hydrate dehydratase [Clostridiales bacterium]
MELYTAAQMRETDRRAIEERGVPSTVLMENAAMALVEEVRSLPIPGPGVGMGPDGPIGYGWITEDGHAPTQEEQAEFWALRQRSAIVFCGPGNNGGDGVAAARLLLEMGWRVKCVLVGDRAKMTDDCLEMERRLVEAGGMLEDFDPEWERKRQYMPFDVAIDALFGVGLTRDLEGDAALAVRMTRWGTGWVVSADVPSGIHADTGDVMGTAVKADVTVTFSRGKPGLFVGQGAAHSGRVVVADIGIPEDLYPPRPQTVLVERELLSLPRRPADSHKGDFGKLFILAGSRGYTGAAALCARAAVRGGAGLTTLAVPGDVYPILAAKCCDEVMVWPWPESDEAVVEKAKGCTAAVIGPGLGQGERGSRLVLRLMKELTCPIILDADGLNLISRHINILDERAGETILTPHDGEFARLSGCELPVRDRLGAAREFAGRHHCTLVLKGWRTIVSMGGGCAVNSTGNPGMAKGGSGDALAGLMGALAAQKLPDAAALAVWLHGRAGDLAAEDKGEYGMTPSDLIERIPHAMKELM